MSFALAKSSKLSKFSLVANQNKRFLLREKKREKEKNFNFSAKYKNHF